AGDIPIGRPEPTLALTPGIAAHGGRLLFLVGDGDHLIDADQRRLIAEALRAAGVRHQMVVYPDTPHGFFCDRRDTFLRPASADRGRRVRALLDDELSSPAP